MLKTAFFKKKKNCKINVIQLSEEIKRSLILIKKKAVHCMCFIKYKKILNQDLHLFFRN